MIQETRTRDSYRINLHAHSIFSDGINTPLVMALEAKRLGLTALVITDHFYGLKIPEFMSVNSMRLLRKACVEAREILPVIIGCEIPLLGQEVLVFGGAAIKSILEDGLPSADEVLRLKEETGCALILCHPGQDYDAVAKLVDGFEEYNSGCNMFNNGKTSRPFGSLESLPRWCNSDAHRAKCLGKGYNLVDSKITTETDLIRYIKRGKQPRPCLPLTGAAT